MATLTDGISIASLTDGMFGGMFGALGAFFAAWLTIRHDRRSRSREQLERAVEADRSNRRAAARGVFAVFDELNREVRYAPFLGKNGVRTFLRAAIDFNINCGPDHPEVADWMFDRFRAYQELARAWRRVCLVPILNRRRAQRVAQLIAEMTGALSKWSSGSIDDGALCLVGHPTDEQVGARTTPVVS